MANDEWDAQNKSVNQVTGASLEREKLDLINGLYAVTLGGPIWRDRAWFFGSYEKDEREGSPFITPVSEEEDTMVSDGTYENYRVTTQLTPKHNPWAKYSTDPLIGILRDYWNIAGPNFAVNAGELEALTAQDQGGKTWGVNWNGIFSPQFAVEALSRTSTTPSPSAPTTTNRRSKEERPISIRAPASTSTEPLSSDS